MYMYNVGQHVMFLLITLIAIHYRANGQEGIEIYMYNVGQRNGSILITLIPTLETMDNMQGKNTRTMENAQLMGIIIIIQ